VDQAVGWAKRSFEVIGKPVPESIQKAALAIEQRKAGITPEAQKPEKGKKQQKGKKGGGRKGKRAAKRS